MACAIRNCLVLLLLATTLGFTACSNGQQSQPLSHWLELANSPKSEDRVAAMEGFTYYSDRVDEIYLPIIYGILDPDTVVKAAAQAAARQIGAPLATKADALLDSADQKDRAAGCELIHHLGPHGQPSIPKLLKMMESNDLKDNNMAIFACVNLQSRDPELKKMAIRYLDDPNFQNQIHAMKILQHFDSDARDTADKLKDLVETGNTSIRGHAMITLGTIGPVEQFDVAAILREGLNAFAFSERERALIGLGRLGRDAQAALGDIEPLLTDEGKALRVQAAVARWQITGDAEVSVKALIKLLEIIDTEEEAVLALGDIGPAASSALGPLCNRLQSPDESFRMVVVAAIDQIGPDDRALKAIQKVAQSDSSALVRIKAAEAVRRHSQ